MQVLALISFYAPVVIIVVSVIAVLFSFFWVFVPMPRATGGCLFDSGGGASGSDSAEAADGRRSELDVERADFAR